MPPNNGVKKTRKQYTRRTAKEKLSEKIARIEAALGDIRSMVDMHCGEQVIKTARAAGAAAADEVLQSLAPANAAAPTSARPASLGPSSLQPATHIMSEAEGSDELEERAAAVPLGEAPLKAKKPGPVLWNEFLKNYMSNQKARGRNITRLQAMAEAGPNYRRKYSLPEPKPRKKTMKVNKNSGGIQIAPAPDAAAAAAPAPAPTRPPKKVTVMRPGNSAPLTPGRPSPQRPLNPTGILNSIASAFTPAAPAAPEAPAASNRPSPETYLYTNQGKNASDPARKIVLDDEEYFMSNEDRGLFRRSGPNIGDWVGYLEPGGRIRYTEEPNA
jgi:hypothetical protein